MQTILRLQMGIGYVPPEVDTFTQAKFKPKSYTWLINLFGYAGYVITILFVIFGSAILLFAGLRAVYLNWTIVSFISAVLLTLMSSELIQRFGVKYFYISENTFTISGQFGRKTVIYKDEIIHIEVDHPNRSLSLLPLISPSLIIVTYDRVYRFRTSRWDNEAELVDIFEELERDLKDEFALYYHRSKTTIHTFLLRMSQDTAGMVGLTIVVIYLFLALWGGMAMLISPIENGSPYTLFLRNPEFGNGDLPGYDWNTARFHPPSPDFWFGTDWVSRDVFARLIYGTTFTFMIAMSGALVSIILVVTLGVTTAFYGGWWDTAVTRLADALLTFPPFIPLILISTIATPIRIAIPGGYFFAVFLAMNVFTWPLGTRIIRTEVIELLNQEYIQSTKQMGASSSYIIVRHILPKIVPTVLILFTYTFSDIILGTTLLGFIGLDSESTLTWGSDLAKAVKFGEDLGARWWIVFFPTAWIFILIFGLTLFGDSIRDILDPKLRGGIKAVPYEHKTDLEL